MAVQPFTLDLPRQPEALARGLCASGDYPADWWTADGIHVRQRAAGGIGDLPLICCGAPPERLRLCQGLGLK
jgi:hypothetical protein